MRYFYDTEFLEDGSTIDLISIGIVADDGREYYAVSSDFDLDRIRTDEWMMLNVVPHLPTTMTSFAPSVEWLTLDHSSAIVKPKWVIANEVREFLLYGQSKPELWAYYGAYDHVALAQLWGKMINLPEGIPMFTHELMHLVEAADCNILPKQTDAHDALADAKWNQLVFNALAGDAS